MTPSLLVSETGRVQRVRLNRPLQLNAYDLEMVLQLRETFERAAEREDIAAIVVDSQGSAFCAGHDFHHLRQMHVRGDGESYRRMMEGLRDVYLQIPRLPQLVVAVVAGTAAGGGWNLALAADICLASPSAFFGHPAVALGFLPELGASQFLSSTIGASAALELLTTGRLIDSTEADYRGLARLAADPEAAASKLAQQAELQDVEARRQLKRAVYHCVRGREKDDFKQELKDRVRFFLSDHCRAAFDRAVEAGAVLN